MTDSIINAIAHGIRNEFHKNKYMVYTENVEQGLIKPCFFIHQLYRKQKHLFDRRYIEKFCFDVTFFPKNRNSKFECAKAENSLYSLLEFIDVDGDLIKGSNINSKIDDNILHFFIEYNIFILKPKEKDKYMEVLQQHGRTDRK